jgi:GNAT superfamily N-acetyltransferase
VIRLATPADAAALCVLLRELGYEVAPAAAAERLARLHASGTDPVFIAVEGDAPLGLVALHWAPMIHLEKPVARITALVVAERARRRGIGRLLIDRAIAVATAAGCGRVELTSANDRSDAHAFYRAAGFQQSSQRFHRELKS